MDLVARAERDGVARVTAYRWFRAGVLPVPARRVGRLIPVGGPGELPKVAVTAIYARVSSADQKAVLGRQVGRVAENGARRALAAAATVDGEAA